MNTQSRREFTANWDRLAVPTLMIAGVHDRQVLPHVCCICTRTWARVTDYMWNFIDLVEGHQLQGYYDNDYPPPPRAGGTGAVITGGGPNPNFTPRGR